MSLSKQLEPLCPVLVFCKLQQVDQCVDPDNVSDKTCSSADAHSLIGLMGIFCGH